MIVRTLRLERGWSQEQLAQMSGLNIRTIQRIESGQKAGLESLKSLAAVFEVELSQLNPQQEPPMNQTTNPNPTNCHRKLSFSRGTGLQLQASSRKSINSGRAIFTDLNNDVCYQSHHQPSPYLGAVANSHYGNRFFI